MDRKFFAFVLVFAISCLSEGMLQLQTHEQDGSEVGEVRLCGDFVSVEFNFTYEEITYRNLSEEWYYVEVNTVDDDVAVSRTDAWDMDWWTDGVLLESASFWPGLAVEVSVYDVFSLEPFQLGAECDSVVLEL